MKKDIDTFDIIILLFGLYVIVSIIEYISIILR